MCIQLVIFLNKLGTVRVRVRHKVRDRVGLALAIGFAAGSHVARWCVMARLSVGRVVAGRLSVH